MDQFICQILHHNRDKIIGFCLSPNCQVKTKQFCLQCAQENHAQCLGDCIQFQNMIPIFDNIINYFQKIEQTAIQNFEETKQKFEKLIKISQSLEDKFFQLKEEINKQNYSIIIDEMKQIKYWYKESKLKKKTRDFNNGLKLLQKKNWKEAEQQLNLEKEDKNYEIAQFFKNWSLVQQNILLNEFKYVERPDELNSDLISKLQTFINYQLSQDANNVIFLITKGILLECNQEYNGAIVQYNQALKQDSQHNYCLYWKCHALIMLQKYKEAEEIIEQMNKIDTNYCLKFIAKGYLLYKQNKFTEALKCYENGIQFYPYYFNFLIYKGLTLIKLDESKKAIEIFQIITQIERQNCQAFLNLGLSLQKDKQYEEAISCFDQAIDLNQKLDKAYQFKCESLRQINNLESANQTVDEWLIIASSKYEPNYQKGLILKQGLKYQDAVVYLTKATEIFQKDPQLYQDLGFCLFELKQFQNSINSFQKALHSNPKDTISLYNIGLCLMKLQKYQESKERFDQVIQLNPQFNKIYYFKGLSLFNIQDYKSAQESFELAIKQNQNDFDSIHQLGLTLTKLKKFSESIKQFDKIIGQKQQNLKIYLSKGHALRKLKQYEKAIKNYDKAINERMSKNQTIIISVTNMEVTRKYNAMPDEDQKLFIQILHKKGLILLKQGKYQQALLAFQEISIIDAKNINSLVYGGLSLCKLQNIQEALEKFAQAIEINPKLPLAHFLQDYFQKQNDYKPKEIITKLNSILQSQIKTQEQKQYLQLLFETLDQGDIDYKNDTYLDEVVELIKKLQKLLLRQ